MGCFNVSCVMSGISMYCDKAVLIPLIQAEYPKDITDLTGAYTVSNDGEQIFYEVMTLPIYGELNSYGALEDFERNSNTKILEKYFGRTIEEIADMSSNAWREDTKDNEGEIKLPKVGSFVKRSIYDAFGSVENSFDESGDMMNVYKDSYLDTATLNLLGFKYIRDDKRERYNQLFIHPDYPGFYGWSDGTWTNFEFEGKTLQYVYHPDTLHEEMVKIFCSSPVDVEKLSKMSPHEVIYDKIAAAHKVSKEEVVSKEAAELAALMRSLLRGITRELTIGHGGFRSFFMDIYGDYLDDPFIRSEYVKLKHFNMNMFMCNKTYMPTMNGCQHGNVFAEKRLHEVALENINEKIKEREE